MTDSNYFDADAYTRDQDAAFADLVLGANRNGVAPLPDVTPPPQTATTPGEDRTSAFRRLMSVGAGAVPFAAGLPLPGALGTVGAGVRAVEDAKPGTMQSLAPREQTPNKEQYGPSTIFKAPTRDASQMNVTYPDITPAPTLQEQARKGLGYAAGVGSPAVGNGLLADWRNAQRSQVDTMGHGADLQLDLGQNKADAQGQMADLRAAQAEQMRQDALRQQEIENDANARHEAFLAQSQKMADTISSQQIDPSRFLHDADAKTQFVIGLGAALGGGLAALNGGPNQFLERLDGIMDRDFKGQLANADNARSALSARNTVFGQIMAQTQDRRLAGLQARDLMYTAMKTKLLSDADRLGIPEIQTQAKVAANEIENKQRALQTQIAQQSYQSAVAAAQAAAAQRAAAEKAAWERGIEMMKLNQEQQKIDIEGQKAGKTANKERDEAQTEVDANLRQLAADKRNIGKLNESSKFGKAYAELAPGWAPGADKARDNASAFKDYNVRAMMMVGAAYKLDTNANEPKNLELLKKYAEPYVFDEGDSEPVKLAKIQRLEELMVKSGAAKGTTVALPPGFTPDAPKGGK